MAKEPRKLIANNKKARHDYFIEDTYEAGICLHGTEVKSLRMGKCSVKESFIRIEDGEVFIINDRFIDAHNGLSQSYCPSFSSESFGIACNRYPLPYSVTIS